MYFNIADFLIEVEGVKKIPPPLNMFRVRGNPKSSDVRISLGRSNGLVCLKGERLIFKSAGFWEIYRWQNKIIFRDRFNGAGLNQGSKFAVFDLELTQGKVYINNRNGDKLSRKKCFNKAILRDPKGIPKKLLHSGHTNKHESVNPLAYPIGALLILNKLSQGEGIFLHASGIKNKDGKGYIFCGRSGIGKTTIARIWQKNKRGITLNDDRIIVRENNRGFYAYGSPWHTRDGRLISNEKAQINKIFFLKQSKHNFAKKLNPKEAFEEIISQAYFAVWDRPAIDFSFGFLNDLCQQTPCFELGFKPTAEIIDFVKKV